MLPNLIDRFSRRITYLRVSVTDRCNFRCVYCMTEHMTFLPKSEVLTLEELERICGIFIGLGVRKLRITGGEPLVRRGIIDLFHALKPYLDSGDLDEITVTTNGSRLKRYAKSLVECGVKRVNVSLDTIESEKFAQITRGASLSTVLEGLEQAVQCGLKIKINCVALKGINEEEVENLVVWCGERGFDLTFIETMPLGALDDPAARMDQYLPLTQVKARLQQHWTLVPLPLRTGGPARYLKVMETGQKLGFITPLTHNFCESCNRVRLTCTGTLYMCLGQEDAADLRAPLRVSPENDQVIETIKDVIQRKPKGHDFAINRSAPTLARYMSTTGG